MVITKEQRILAYFYNNETAEECQNYASYIGDLLMSQVEYQEPQANNQTNSSRFATLATADCDLLIYNDPAQPRLGRWLFGSSARQLIRHIPASLWLARQPRWPIRHILLILRSDMGDETAVTSVQEIVQRNQASVTIMPIIPPVPAMYGYDSYTHLGLDVWAAIDNSLESNLGRLAHWLISQHTTAILRLRPGDPHWQIRQEIAEGDYDLIVLAAEPAGRLFNWLFGELVGPLLDGADRPILVTQSFH